MSYEPTNWKDGDLVTSAKLNKIEQGIADSSGSSGGGNIEIIEAVSMNGSIVLQKTAGEIIEYADSGKLVFLRSANAEAFICGFMSGCQAMPSSYIFYFLINNGPSKAAVTVFTASTSSDYPATEPTGR